MGRVKVDSIGTIVVNEQELKWIAVSTLDGYCAGWYPSKIYETLGNWIFLFPGWVDCIVDGEEAAGLRCYSDNIFGFYQSPDWQLACDYLITDVNNEDKDNLVTVYPNPCKGQLNISSHDESLIVEVSFFNVLNQKVFENKISNTILIS